MQLFFNIPTTHNVGHTLLGGKKIFEEPVVGSVIRMILFGSDSRLI
jgi:hypothetical protein